MWEIEEWMVLIFLLIGAIWDIARRTIPVWYLVIGTIGAMVCQIVVLREPLLLVVFGIFTGMLFILISKVTNEGIGYGDSWMIVALGIYLGVWKLLVALAMAFLMAAIFAGIGMAGKICKRRTRLPFLPFLLIGYLGVCGW